MFKALDGLQTGVAQYRLQSQVHVMLAIIPALLIFSSFFISSLTWKIVLSSWRNSLLAVMASPRSSGFAIYGSRGGVGNMRIIMRRNLWVMIHRRVDVMGVEQIVCSSRYRAIFCAPLLQAKKSRALVTKCEVSCLACPCLLYTSPSPRDRG